MTYTPNVPQANQQIAATQGPIEANFQYLAAAIGQEHHFVNNPATDTYHLKASMPNLSGGDPANPPAGTNGMYYVLGGEAKFISGNSNAICQLTKGSATVNGYQWIGRVLLQWGFKNVTVDTSSSVVFPIAFPTACFSVQTTPYYGASAPSSGGTANAAVQNNSPTSPTTTGFSFITRSPSSVYTGFYWMAVGN